MPKRFKLRKVAGFTVPASYEHETSSRHGLSRELWETGSDAAIYGGFSLQTAPGNTVTPAVKGTSRRMDRVSPARDQQTEVLAASGRDSEGNDQPQ